MRVLREVDKKYIVWTDYGTEGWRPETFDTDEEVAQALLESSYGQRVVTQRMDLRLVFVGRVDL